MYKYVGCYIECKMLSGLAAFSSLEVEELNVEHQGGVGGDDGGVPASAVGVVRGAGQLGTLADGHLRDALVPALDDLAHADLEGELVAAVAGAVELVPVGKGAGVVHEDGLSLVQRIYLIYS